MKKRHILFIPSDILPACFTTRGRVIYRRVRPSVKQLYPPDSEYMSSNRVLQLEDVRILESATRAREDDATSTIVSTVCDEINPKVACKRHSLTCFSNSIWTQGLALETSHDVVPVYSLALNRLEEDAWQRVVSALPPAQRVDVINSKPVRQQRLRCEAVSRKGDPKVYPAPAQRKGVLHPWQWCAPSALYSRRRRDGRTLGHHARWGSGGDVQHWL